MHTFTDTQTDAAATLRAGQLLATSEQKPVTLDEGGIPFVIDGDGNTRSLERFLPMPCLHRAAVVLDDTGSFISYVKKYQRAGTLIFASVLVTGGSFTAVLDYPQPGETSWREHTAVLKLIPTPDWLAWATASGKWQSHEAFCDFVEKFRGLFTVPKAADMLEISRNIEAKKEGAFKSGVRLSNGDRTLLWESTTSASAGPNKIEIPEEVGIFIKPFEGGAPVNVQSFLRYRIQGAAVQFMVELQHPEEIIREAATEARSRIETETLLLVLAGHVDNQINP